jgi:hypothetical protein
VVVAVNAIEVCELAGTVNHEKGTLEVAYAEVVVPTTRVPAELVAVVTWKRMLALEEAVVNGL